ncbi:MAG: lycopene cyclase family protein, partial [Prochlorococcus sp.]
LRRAPGFADAIAAGLRDPDLQAAEVARLSWQALWPMELRRKRALYLFGIEKILRFSEDQLRQFFETFFNLPREDWYGFLANSMSLPRLVSVMIKIFLTSPWNVKRVLMHQRKRELSLLKRVVKDSNQGQFSFQQ